MLLKKLIAKKLLTQDENGKVGVPLLMWFFGVPGFICILLWLFFFKG